jgi:hypothetical protein
MGHGRVFLSVYKVLGCLSEKRRKHEQDCEYV